MQLKSGWHDTMNKQRLIRYCIIAAGILVSAAFYVFSGAAADKGEVVFIEDGETVQDDITAGTSENVSAGQLPENVDLSDEEHQELKQIIRDAVREELLAICEEGYLETAIAEAVNEAARETELKKDMVNINTADAAELMTLPGIGEKRAGDIVAYRNEHGSFAAPSDIMQVDGIKEAAYAKIRDKIYT